MTRDMVELYISVLKKGYQPKIKKEYVIELTHVSGAKHWTVLVSNDFLRAIKYDAGTIGSDTTLFFKRLKHIWDKDNANRREGECEVDASSGSIQICAGTPRNNS